ncbi:hypothetical protein [Halorientalis marina]|uniref:hypothetical protein n=1 Tax=Halorientalis marina TaxID=2931976 RepID=UPI001FF5CB00|nr:hypothetical protein [Halorientalis marina]
MGRISRDAFAVDVETRRRWRHRVVHTLFGDRLGLIIFLASLSFVLFYWRVGVFITDNYAVGNTLANLAEGRLAIERTPYSLTLGAQPGLVEVDGVVYGRNYGHAAIAVPVLLILQGVSVVFDVSVFLAASWSLLVLELARQSGQLLDRQRLVGVLGSAVAGGTFLFNIVFSHSIGAKWLPFVTLQLVTALAAAFVGVTLYRLLARIHGHRVGATIGFAAVCATPLGFWATIPKRHLVTALAAVVVLATFYESRRATEARRALVLRACSYVSVALTTWIHAPEAFLLFVVLVPLDLVTARSNHPKTLLVIGVAFALAFTPFLATNLAISGNPVEPPRLQSPYDSGSDDEVSTPTPTDRSRIAGNQTASETAVTGTAAGARDNRTAEATQANDAVNGTRTSGSTNESRTTTAPTPPPNTAPPDDRSPSPIARVSGAIEDTFEDILQERRKGLGIAGGVSVIFSQPEQVYHTFVRSGRIPASAGVDYAVNQQEAIELTVLESAPIFATFLVLPVLFVSRLRTLFDGNGRHRLASALARPERQTDILAAAITIMYTITYLSLLPIHTQITVRYLIPAFAVMLYGVGRIPSLRRVLETDSPLLATIWAGGTGILTACFLIVNATLALALGEAMQMHAIAGLGCATLLGTWTIAASMMDRGSLRSGTVVLGLVLSVATSFLLLTGLVYFDYGTYAIPLGRVLMSLIPA